MFYNSEIAFVSEFAACLKKKGVTSIPLYTEDFEKGIEEAAHYFQTKRGELGDTAYEIAMLFVKTPLEGAYSRFADAVLYVTNEGKLDFAEAGAEYILQKNRSGIPTAFTEECALRFCTGANLQ